LLDRKRAQLQRQFQGLESALAALQSQQSSLAALTSLANQVALGR
jgi:flagellar capping protein FliD